MCKDTAMAWRSFGGLAGDYGTGQKLFERLSGEKPRRASEHDYDAVFSSGAEAKSQFDEVSKREPDRRGFKDSSVKYLKGKYISS